MPPEHIEQEDVQAAQPVDLRAVHERNLVTKETIMHLREYEIDGHTISPNGGMTVHYQLEYIGQPSQLMGSYFVLKAGVAVTHNQDVFDKWFGRQLAASRFNGEEVATVQRRQPPPRNDGKGTITQVTLPPHEIPFDPRLFILKSFRPRDFTKEELLVNVSEDGTMHINGQNELVERVVLDHLEHGLFQDLDLDAEDDEDEDFGDTVAMVDDDDIDLDTDIDDEDDEDEDEEDDVPPAPKATPAKRIH